MSDQEFRVSCGKFENNSGTDEVLTCQDVSLLCLVITRTIDIIGAIGLMIFLAPLMILTGLAVYLTNPGPVFFSHERIGRNGRMFKCHKFRSMMVGAEQALVDLLARDPQAREQWAREHKLRKDPRVTRLGRFLRKSSIDELPQLWNVLKGEMSFVGPRPISLEEGVRYGRYVTEYMSMRPGITGLWQVSGRNDVSYRRRVALDVLFARSYSVKLYLRIALKTVPAVLLARGSC